MKKYKFGFDWRGLVLFLIIMLPNFIWFAVPAPNDILRAESVTETVDLIGAVCQVIMVGALCFLVNKDQPKLKFTPLIIGMTVCVIGYFAGWIFYYCGVTNAVVILALTVPPMRGVSAVRAGQKELYRAYPDRRIYGLPFDLRDRQLYCPIGG